MDLIYRIRDNYRTEFIRGNKEDYWLDRKKTGRGFHDRDWKEYDSTTGCAYYTYARLRQKDLDFYASLPIAKIVRPEGKEEIFLALFEREYDKWNTDLKSILDSDSVSGLHVRRQRHRKKRPESGGQRRQRHMA